MFNKKPQEGPKGSPKKSLKSSPKGKPKKSSNPKAKQVTATPSAKVKTQNDSAVLKEMDLGNETISLPVYSNYVDKDCEIDAFIVDVLRYCEDEVIKPFFIGDYNLKSFDMYIKNSSIGIEPSDKINSGDEVINLKRKGI